MRDSLNCYIQYAERHKNNQKGRNMVKYYALFIHRAQRYKENKNIPARLNSVRALKRQLICQFSTN